MTTVLQRVKANLEYDGIEVKCLSRSICKETGAEITTHFVRMPRIILPEVNTHRIFSRNVASSRAIPVLKMLENLNDVSILLRIPSSHIIVMSL